MASSRPDLAPTSTLDRLIQRLTRLPGVGKRSAERVVFHLLKQPPEEAEQLAAAIRDLRRNVRHCAVCFNLCEAERCDVCNDPRRDAGTIMVVEQPSDVVSLETTGLYRGVYHVLMGRLAPLDGVGPGELNIPALLERLRSKAVVEVILATNPTLEGDGTALYLVDVLAQARSDLKITRLARGLPTGQSLDVVSKAVLADALQGRQGATDWR
jgi:recombination protein RecR